MQQEGETLALRTVLLPRDTNGAGTIFGGIILSQIDLAGAATARLYACHRYVTVAMKEVEFHKPAYVGDHISYFGRILRVGRTSLTTRIRVEAERFHDCSTLEEITTADVTYVAVDEDLRPIEIAARSDP
jgi:acyl-CoA thioesterase YciA